MFIDDFGSVFSLYTAQQFIYRFVCENFYTNKLLVVVFIFISGLISALSPCMFSLIPIVFIYLNTGHQKNRHVVSFFVGLITTLVFLLLLFSFCGNKYYFIMVRLPLISCTTFILLGLLFLNIISIEIKIDILNNVIFKFNNVFLVNYFIGSFLAISNAPCSAPMLVTLMAFLSFFSNYVMLFTYISVYFIGYIFILLISSYLMIQIHERNIINVTLVSNLINSWSGFIILTWGLLKFLEIFFI